VSPKAIAYGFSFLKTKRRVIGVFQFNILALLLFLREIEFLSRKIRREVNI
jgi:hypothetical protein